MEYNALDYDVDFLVQLKLNAENKKRNRGENKFSREKKVVDMTFKE